MAHHIYHTYGSVMGIFSTDFFFVKTRSPKSHGNCGAPSQCIQIYTNYDPTFWVTELWNSSARSDDGSERPIKNVDSFKLYGMFIDDMSTIFYHPLSTSVFKDEMSILYHILA